MTGLNGPFYSGIRQVDGTISGSIKVHSSISTGTPDIIAATVKINANIAASVLVDTIDSPLGITSEIVGGIPNVINSQIMIWRTITGDSYGVTSTATLPIPIRISASGGVFNTIAGMVKVHPTISGQVVPFGQIVENIKPVITASGGLPNQINIPIRVGISASGGLPNIGTLVVPVPINASISGNMVVPSGTISIGINFGKYLASRIAVTGQVYQIPIIISGSSSNRAQSFLTVGNPVPQSYGLGTIRSSINIGATITTAPIPTRASISVKPIPITVVISGFTTARGSISAAIPIRSTIGNVGAQIAKAVPYTVLARSRLGVEVVKASPLVIISPCPPASGELISKSVAYAVVMGQGIIPNYGYAGFIFQ